MISFAISAKKLFFYFGRGPYLPVFAQVGPKSGTFSSFSVFFFKNYWIAIKVISKYYIRQADSVNFMILPQ